MDYRDNRQRWTESHQVVHFYAGQWCTFTPALTAHATKCGLTEVFAVGDAVAESDLQCLVAGVIRVQRDRL